MFFTFAVVSETGVSALPHKGVKQVTIRKIVSRKMLTI